MHPDISESGTAIISFKDHLCKTTLKIISLWFGYGESNKLSLIAGGLTMFISSSMSVNIIIFNVTAQENSETNGNLALYLIDYAKGSSSSVVINRSRIVDGRGEKDGFRPILAKTLEYPSLLVPTQFSE